MELNAYKNIKFKVYCANYDFDADNFVTILRIPIQTFTFEQHLARLIYHAASKTGRIDIKKVEEILGISREDVCSGADSTSSYPLTG